MTTTDPEKLPNIFAYTFKPDKYGLMRSVIDKELTIQNVRVLIATTRKEADEEIKELKRKEKAQWDMKNGAYDACLKFMEENKMLLSKLATVRKETIDEFVKVLRETRNLSESWKNESAILVFGNWDNFNLLSRQVKP